MEREEVEHLFGADSEKDVKTNIINLDQKLKGLHAEVQAKLSTSELYEGDGKQAYIDRLNNLSEEVAHALKGIAILVDILISADTEVQNAFYQSDEIKQFNKSLSERLIEITKLKQGF